MSSSNKPKLLCDENIPIKVTELLKERGFDVKKASLNSTDKQISKIARLESRVILTFDKHFINRHLFPPEEYPGIIFLDIHPPMIDTIFSALSKLFKEVKFLEFKSKLFILSSFGFRVKG
jgi:predicted nuclease of predicted toxin-antitoxin system